MQPPVTPTSYARAQASSETSEVVQQLRVRGVCESVLEARLGRLVRRQRFQEALEFAKKFRLPREQVYQVRNRDHNI